MKERLVQVEGVRLRALEKGSGPAILALHGFTGDATTMSEVVAGLGDGARTVRLELIGHGGSESPDSIEPYSMPSCVRQVVGVTKALDIGRPHVVGYSMGGRTALSAAADPSSAFRSLTLIGTTAGIEHDDLRKERIAADERLADRIERDGLEAFVDDWMALPLFASQTRLGRSKLAEARAQRLANSPRGLAQSLRGMGAGAQPPLHERLASIRIPVLLLSLIHISEPTRQRLESRLAGGG